MHTITLRLEEELWLWLDEQADSENRSINGLLVTLIQQHQHRVEGRGARIKRAHPCSDSRPPSATPAFS